MAVIPLPVGSNAQEMIRRLRAIDAEFSGFLAQNGSITDATLGDLTVTGDITLDGGTIRTSASGRRAELTDVWLAFYDDSDNVAAYLRSNPTSDYFEIVGGVSYGAPSIVLDDGKVNISDIELDVNTAQIHFSAHTGETVTSDAYIGMNYSGASGNDWYFSSHETTSMDPMAMSFSADAFRILDDNVWGLGATVFSVNSSGRTHISDGTATLPGLAFISDSNTGISRANADELSLVAGGTRQLVLSTTAMTSPGGIPLRLGNGSVSAPTYSFGSDTDTGIYRFGTHGLAVATAGVLAFRTRNSGTDKEGILVPSGSVSAPTYAFDSDADTGLYRPASNQIAIAVGGTQEFLLGASGVYIQNVYDSTTSSSANVYVAADGRLWRDTSARKYKTDIEPVDLSAIPLQAYEYRSKATGERHYGLIADEVAAVLPDAGVYNKGELENYDTRAVIAVLVSKVNELEKKMEKCGCSS